MSHAVSAEGATDEWLSAAIVYTFLVTHYCPLRPSSPPLPPVPFADEWARGDASLQQICLRTGSSRAASRAACACTQLVAGPPRREGKHTFKGNMDDRSREEEG